MPNPDSENIEIWSDPDVSLIFSNENYVRQFSELVTRRLRRQLQPQREIEPRYTHRLERMEAIALYFIESALYSDNSEEQKALFHEAAILFEQLSYLFTEPDLVQSTELELTGQRFSVASLCYYLAGYEANAIVLANEYLSHQFEKSTVGNACAQLLAKQLTDLKKTLAEVLIQPDLAERSIADIDNGSMTIGDAIYLASEKTYCLGISAFQHWIRTGNEELRSEAIQKLRLALKGFDGCGRILDSMIIRLLIQVFGIWFDRSIWTGLSPVLGGESAPIWRKYIRLLSVGKSPVTEFWRSQLNLIKPLIEFGQGLVVSMPTSSGKTRIAEIAILAELTQSPDKKVIYVVPTRSLAAEVESVLSKRLPFLDYSVSYLFGGYDLSEYEKELIATRRVLVVTPEKLDLLLRQDKEFIGTVGLIVVDEGHQVGQGQRGLRLEFILSRIRWHAVNADMTRLLFLSAVLPNGAEIAKWIAGDATATVEVDWKPTRLRQLAFKWGEKNPNDGQLLYLDTLDENIEKFVPGVLDKRQIKDRAEALAALAIHFVSIGPVLIFTIRPVEVVKIAKTIASMLEKKNILSLSIHQAEINKHVIPVVERIIGSDHQLVSFLKQGFAFHYGPLPKEVRQTIEEAVRNEIIPLVIANETLAQGVNLPIKTLVIDTVNRGNAPMSVRDFWNVAGRSGRAGKEIEGTIVFFPDNNWKYPPYLGPILDKDLENCESMILQSAFDSITPEYKEWSDLWKKKWTGRFTNPWPYIISVSVEKLHTILGEQIADDFKKTMTIALADRLTRGYDFKRWSDDKWTWRTVFVAELRKIYTEDNSLSEVLDIDEHLERQLKEIVDSQILAMTAEEILDPDNPDSPSLFVPHTLLGANNVTTNEMRAAFANGLKKRFLAVLRAVPDKATRDRFNKTGLSLTGNQYLSEQIDLVTINIYKWIFSEITWNEMLTSILDVVNVIPDLKPKKGQKRTVQCILDWVNGQSITDIAKNHFGGDLNKAVQVVEGSIVGLIPWGINSLFIQMAEHKEPIDVRSLSNDFANMPAMVAYGMPTTPAVFASAVGITDRATAIKIGQMFEVEHADPALMISYGVFMGWYSNLLNREAELLEYLGNIALVNDVLQKAKSLDLKRLHENSVVSISIDNDNKQLFNDGEEVLLTVDDNDNEWCEMSVRDYLYNKRISLKVSKYVGQQSETTDYIAMWKHREDEAQLVIEFFI